MVALDLDCEVRTEPVAWAEYADQMNAVVSAIDKEWESNGGEGGGEKLREFRDGAKQALHNLSTILLALREGREVGLPPADLSHNERLMNYAYMFPGEITHYVYGLELVARLLFSQKDILVKDRREWLTGLLQHMTGEGRVTSPEVAKNAYAGDNYLEIMRLANAIWHISRTRSFDKRGPVLLGGVSSGSRVEGPAMDKLKEGGEVFDPTVEIIGLDGLPPKKHYPGMQLRKGDLQRMVEQFPDLIKRINLAVLMGSVTSNMNLVVEQARYWLELAAVMRDGGYMYMNLAAIEPLGEQNERAKRSALFARENDILADGSLPVNSLWRRETDKPAERGARIQFLLELLALARFTNFEVINFPAMGTDEWRELMDKANDVDTLRKETARNKDSMAMPFYLAKVADEGITVRMDIICEKRSRMFDFGARGAELTLHAILSYLWKRQDPLPGASN